jgi:hypothetical protein
MRPLLPQLYLRCLDYPDLPLEAALGYVNHVRLVPVVKLEGVISSEAVLKKYRGSWQQQASFCPKENPAPCGAGLLAA